jgi:hypothetical protein
MIPGITPTITEFPQVRASFLGSILATSTQATVGFGNITPTKPGLMVMAYVGRASVAGRTITSVSIGGSTANVHLASAASTDPHFIASRVVSSGANAISITFNTTTTTANHAMGFWLLENYLSTSPTGTDGQALTASTVISTTFPASMGGVAVWGVRTLTTTSNVFGSATPRLDTTVGSLRFSFADRKFYAAESSHVQTVSNTTSASRIGIGGSWR